MLKASQCVVEAYIVFLSQADSDAYVVSEELSLYTAEWSTMKANKVLKEEEFFYFLHCRMTPSSSEWIWDEGQRQTGEMQICPRSLHKGWHKLAGGSVLKAQPPRDWKSSGPSGLTPSQHPHNWEKMRAWGCGVLMLTDSVSSLRYKEQTTNRSTFLQLTKRNGREGAKFPKDSLRKKTQKFSSLYYEWWNVIILFVLNRVRRPRMVKKASLW